MGVVRQLWILLRLAMFYYMPDGWLTGEMHRLPDDRVLTDEFDCRVATWARPERRLPCQTQDFLGKIPSRRVKMSDSCKFGNAVAGRLLPVDVRRTIKNIIEETQQEK